MRTQGTFISLTAVGNILQLEIKFVRFSDKNKRGFKLLTATCS
jgi:hypothetical protein